MTTRTPREGAVWDDGRCIDLDTLGLLLHEVAAINSGSHCLCRIARCIELAGQLNRGDRSTGRQSFMQFLGELAITDRFPE